MIEDQMLIIECACSKTRKTWHVALQRDGNKWIFGKNFTSEQYRTLKRQLEDSDSRAIEQRLAELDAQNPRQIKPPPQVDVRLGLRSVETSRAELSSFGFECPHCGQYEPLSCSVCGGISCIGKVDHAGRTRCVQCGETLQLGVSGPGEANPTPIRGLRATVKGVEM